MKTKKSDQWKWASLLALFLLLFHAQLSWAAPRIEKPWSNGRLQVSANGRFLQFANGKPFFWLGDTGWLLPERLNQVQTVNGVPAINAYGKLSMPKGFDFSTIDTAEGYGYWQHLDYIVDVAASNGIYIGMVCIWGGLVKSGQMNVEQA